MTGVPKMIRQTRSSLALAMSFLACLACSGDKKSGDVPAPAPTSTPTQPAGFEFSTGPFTIQPGDNFECFYTATTTARPMNVQSALAKQGPGGHHVTVYYTDQKVPVGHHACSDVEMLGLHQIAGAGDGKEGVVGLPDGYATKIPEGKQLVVQTHYVRTEDGPLTVEDSVSLQTIEDKDVKAFANSFVIVDTNFEVPPRATKTSKTICTVPKDLDVLILVGHMHEWGQHYKLEFVDDKGATLETLYDKAWEPLFVSHPPINNYAPAKPLHLKKGMKIRQTCDWQNTEDAAKTFPREMCVMFSYYIPDDGFIQCETVEDKK
jgi:hypothetical protein